MHKTVYTPHEEVFDEAKFPWLLGLLGPLITNSAFIFHGNAYYVGLRRGSIVVVLITMLLFSARSRLHHGIVLSNYFNEFLDYIKGLLASKMAFKEKQKTKKAAPKKASSNARKRVQ